MHFIDLFFIIDSQFFSFSGFFLAVIIFLSVAGNLLVCIAVYTDRYETGLFNYAKFSQLMESWDGRVT